jgi:hypothetical protein
MNVGVAPNIIFKGKLAYLGVEVMMVPEVFFGT